MIPDRTVEFKVGELTLELLPERALYIEQTKTLVIADLHLGKAGHFRKAGVAIPSRTHQDDLHCLKVICSERTVEELVILGDLFHSRLNLEFEDFRVWLGELDIPCRLIRGNHDRMSESYYTELGVVAVHDELEYGPIRFSHEPIDRVGNETVICGHIHPGIRLRDNLGPAERFPCFLYRDRQLILPAFGSFTGLAIQNLSCGDQCWIIAGERVIKVPF